MGPPRSTLVAPKRTGTRVPSAPHELLLDTGRHVPVSRSAFSQPLVQGLELGRREAEELVLVRLPAFAVDPDDRQERSVRVRHVPAVREQDADQVRVDEAADARLALTDRGLGAVAPRDVGADEIPDEDQEAEEEAAADPERREKGTGRLARAPVPDGEKRPLFGLHLDDELPDRVHGPLADPRPQVSACLLVMASLRHLDRAAHLEEPVFREVPKLRGARPLRRAVGRERGDPLEPPRELGDRRPVRIEIGVRARSAGNRAGSSRRP